MDPSNPQIITHVQKSLNYTLFDAKFVPRSAKFVSVGSKANGSGVIQLYEITHDNMKGDVKLVKDVSCYSYTYYSACSGVDKIQSV